jgi:hypothetical protein
LVKQALKAIDDQQMTTASLHSRPIARFAALYCNSHSKGNPFRERDFNDASTIQWLSEMRQSISPRAAQSFAKCWKASRVPPWVAQYVDVEQIIDFARMAK